MKSKIRVEYDFDKKEPYLQFYIVDTNEPGTELDMRDSMLKAFIQDASNKDFHLNVEYPSTNVDNCCPQIRVNKTT